MVYPDIISLLLTGALAGLSAGYIGIGGGAVLTPLCLVIFPALGIESDDLIKIIFGTNMLLVMVFSISAVWKHHKNNNIEWRTVLILGPLAILGSVVGSWLASIADPSDMKQTFAVVLLISSFLIIAKNTKDPDSAKKRSKPLVSKKFIPLLGFAAGMIGAFLGMGGGVIMITPLILLFNFPIEKVAGTSSSVIIFIGLAGTIGYMFLGHGNIELPGWSQGYVWLSAAIPLMIGGVPMAQVGAWLNSKTNNKLLKIIFGVTLFIISIKMFF
ncbi:sulfite exporter TauE/SafE family protein [Candidatus Latescibacterota bacterium]